MIFILILLLILSPYAKEGRNKMDGLENKKIVMVIAQTDFRDEELFVPKDIFELEQGEVIIASTSIKKAVGMLGVEIMPNKKIEDLKITQFDALIIVGGTGSKKYLWDNETLLKLVIAANKEKKVIGAICLSPVILAKSSILIEKKATVFKTNETMEIFKKNKVLYLDEDVVIDDKIVTANGPSASKKFAQTIVKLLKGIK